MAGRAFLIALVQLYRWTLSYFIGGRCRFYPSCSCYAQQALHIHGVRYGVWLTMRRLSRCHPYHPGGVDPVPPLRIEK